MRLDNISGVLGAKVLLQLISIASRDFDFFTAASFLILSDSLRRDAFHGARAVLIPQNPLHF